MHSTSASRPLDDQRRQHRESLIDAIDLPIGRWSRGGRLLFCNRPYLDWSGRSREALIGRHLGEIYGEAAWSAAAASFEQAFAGRTVSYERMLTHLSGGARWARVQVFPDFAEDGRVDAVFTIAFDIHDDMLRQRALEDAARRLDRFTENIPDPLVYADRDGVVRFANKAYLRAAGLEPGQLLGRRLAEARGERHWEEHRPFIERALRGETTQYTRMMDWPPMGRRWARTSYVPDHDAEGRVVGLYTVTTDVHELTLAQERLRRSAELDALTEVYSRRAIMDRIDIAVLQAAERPVALYFVDLDGFKAVNDAAGHRQGDRVLAAVARALQQAAPPPGAVGRFGGDEFLVLAPAADRDEAEACARRLLQAVSEATAQAAPGFAVTASIGFALAPSDALQALALIQVADDAMYAAKRQGRGCAVRLQPGTTPWR